MINVGVLVEALTFEEIVVMYQILYFSDTASIEEHLYIDDEKCVCPYP